MAFRNPTELKEADKEGVKAWLASFETKDKEAGTKNNADKLFIPVRAQLAQIMDQFIKHLNVDYPQPRAVMYKKLLVPDFSLPKKAKKRSKSGSKLSRDGPSILYRVKKGDFVLYITSLV